MVPRSSDDWRSCGDYKALNQNTILDSYPIPHIQDFFGALHEANIFGNADLVKAYSHISMKPADILKTTNGTSFGIFEYLQMPFGLCDKAQLTFQRFID